MCYSLPKLTSFKPVLNWQTCSDLPSAFTFFTSENIIEHSSQWRVYLRSQLCCGYDNSIVIFFFYYGCPSFSLDCQPLEGWGWTWSSLHSQYLLCWIIISTETPATQQAVNKWYETTWTNSITLWPAWNRAGEFPHASSTHTLLLSRVSSSTPAALIINANLWWGTKVMLL